MPCSFCRHSNLFSDSVVSSSQKKIRIAIFRSEDRIIIANNSLVYQIISVKYEHIGITSASECKIAERQHIVSNVIVCCHLTVSKVIFLKDNSLLLRRCQNRALILNHGLFRVIFYQVSNLPLFPSKSRSRGESPRLLLQGYYHRF